MAKDIIKSLYSMIISLALNEAREIESLAHHFNTLYFLLKSPLQIIIILTIRYITHSCIYIIKTNKRIVFIDIICLYLHNMANNMKEILLKHHYLNFSVKSFINYFFSWSLYIFLFCYFIELKSLSGFFSLISRNYWE